MRKKFYEIKKWSLLPFLILCAVGSRAQYCTVGVTYDVEPITRVQFGSIDNTSSGTVNGTPVQQDFTAMSTSVVPGTSYPITIYGNTAGNWTNYMRVFIDWNGDFDFDDASESYDIGTIVNCTNCSVSGNILVPAAPVATTTRMRVMKKYNAYGTSCETLGFGQVEDYTININAAPCAGVPAGGTANASAASVCPSVSFSVNVAGAGTGTGLTYQWQNSPDGLVWTDISGATGPGYNGTQIVATSYRRRIICSAGPDTAYSTAATVTMTPFLNCYCTAAATSTLFEKIASIQFGPLTNTSNSTAGYEDFTGLPVLNFFEGLDYTFTLNISNAYVTDQVIVWIDFNQNGQFSDPGETVFTSPTGLGPVVSGINIPGGVNSGITRMRIRLYDTDPFGAPNSTPCGTSTYGQVEDYYINVLPPPADEAGVLAITKPEIAACALGQEVWVNVQNLGTNPLTSATFVVKVNGLSIPVSNPWTGNIAPQSNSEIQVPLTYSLADGDSVSIEVSQPNGLTEDTLFAFNNVISRRVYAGLSGNKTVYGAAPDFTDLAEALQALELRGVCDTVYFKIGAGTYTTQHTFMGYLGAGAGHLAVFESATGNAADATFAFDATSSGDNFVFQFDASDGYLVRDLTLQALDPDYAKVVTYANAPQNIWLEENIIIGDTTATYDAGDFERINISGFDNTDPAHLFIRNNQIIGGNRSIDIEGSTAAYGSDFVIEGNTFEMFNVVGALVANVSKPVINNNIVRPRAGVTGNVYGVYVERTIDGGSLSGNDVQTWNPGFLFYISNVKGGSTDYLISNNFLYGGDSSNTTAYGIYILDVNSSDIVIANNSIAFNNDNSASGAITVTDGSQIRFFNNNIGVFGDAPAVRIEESYSVSESNYNNIYGANLANVLGTVYATLANLQAGTSRDANSLSVVPGFNGTDLHTCTAALNGSAWPMATVTADIDGDARSATSDIGADEFLGDANGLLAEDAFLKCPADQVTLGGEALNGVTYAWTPSGNTAQITTANAGTYIVTATSSCGSFSDTAVVTNKPLPTASFGATSVGLAGVFNNTSTNGISYLWDFGDGATSTAFSPSHVYASAGTYSISLTVTNDCGSATFGPTAVNVVNAGIEESALSVEVALFPNPTSDRFTVTLAGVNGDVTLTVLDMTGKAVLSKNIPAGTNQLTLDATAFASGVYSVRISGTEFSKVIRLVRK